MLSTLLALCIHSPQPRQFSVNQNQPLGILFQFLHFTMLLSQHGSASTGKLSHSIRRDSLSHLLGELGCRQALARICGLFIVIIHYLNKSSICAPGSPGLSTSLLLSFFSLSLFFQLLWLYDTCYYSLTYRIDSHQEAYSIGLDYSSQITGMTTPIEEFTCTKTAKCSCQ